MFWILVLEFANIFLKSFALEVRSIILVYRKKVSMF